MITMRRQLLGLGFLAASSLLAMNAAHALNGPTAIQIDGGPLGQLEVSGGVDGYGYYVSGTKDDLHNYGMPGQVTTGMNVGSAIIQVQKTTGELQFNIEVGSTGGGIAVGAPSWNDQGHLSQTTVNNFVTGPLYQGYITVAPKDMPFTISAGMLGSLEGYEATLPWYNPSQLTTDMWSVTNSSARGVEGTLTEGPMTLTVEFGDGWDTGVFNFLQAMVTYNFDSNNILNVFYAGNLGRTGLNTKTFGDTRVSDYGPWFMNSQMFGAYYSYTIGNLNLIPEVQYVYAKTDHKLGIDKTTSNLGAAVFGTYSFANTPYSLGGWIEYENSQGGTNNQGTGYTWFVGPRSEGVGFAIAPTWQYKDVYARVNAGGFYLLRNKYSYDGTTYTYGYGNHNDKKFQFIGTLEGGLLF